MNAEMIGSWVLAIGYFIVVLLVGFWASKKIKSFESYIIAGRDLGFWAFTILVITSCMSGMTLLGSSGLGYIAGWPTIWEQIFVPFSCAVTIFLFGSKLHRVAGKMKYLTLQDYLAHRFESPRLIRGITGLAVFVTSLIYLVGQYTAIGITLERVLGLSYQNAVIIGAVVVTIYVLIGGMYAVGWTNIVQGAIIILGVMGVAPIIIAKAGGLTHVNEVLATIDPNYIKAAFPQVHPPYKPYAFMTPVYIVSFFFLLTFGLAAAPHNVNNILAARKNSYFKWAPLAAFSIYLCIFYLIKIVGFSARVMTVEGKFTLPQGVANPQDFCFILSVQNSFSPLIWTLFGVIVLAAVMSTTDRLLLTIGTSFSWDVYRNIINPKASDRSVTSLSKVVVFLAAILSILLALNPPSLLAFLIWAGIGVMLSVFVTPILAGLYWKRATRAGAVAATVIGFLTAIGFAIVDRFMFKMPFHFSFIPFLLSIVSVFLVSYMTRPTSEKVLNETETGLWF
jgi:SSS family solute:Na+ symporter